MLINFSKFGKDSFNQFKNINKKFIDINTQKIKPHKLVEDSDLFFMRRESYKVDNKNLPKIKIHNSIVNNKKYYDFEKLNYYIAYHSWVYWNILEKNKNIKLIEFDSVLNINYNQKTDFYDIILPEKYFMPYPFNNYELKKIDESIYSFYLNWEILGNKKLIGNVHQNYKFTL